MALRKVAYIFISGLLWICIALPLAAQKTSYYTTELSQYRDALDLYDKEKFGAAQRMFEIVIKTVGDPNKEVLVNSEYYRALCALQLYNRDGDFLMSQFIDNYPESPRVALAVYQLGNYHYSRKKYEEALEWYQQVDPFDLSENERNEYYFKKGYTYLMLDQPSAAKQEFYEVIDKAGRYHSAASYYYGHIAYQEKNYETALKSFQNAMGDEAFGPVVPYYIAQIYHLQGKYEKVIEFAPGVLDGASEKRQPEIARIIGEAYYKLEKYPEAIPYLKRYYASGKSIRREDHYQLGYAYYKSSDCASAVNYFNKVGDPQDSLSQTAYYHLGQCYLQTNEKTYARNAFKTASQLNFNRKIQEDALFSYALLSYEIAFDPYYDAITAFKTYIESYPNGSRLEDAYEYLLNIYMNTQNYDEALTYLNKFQKKDLRVQTAIQYMQYNKGITQFINQEFENSIQTLIRVRDYPVVKELNASALYWTAEAFFQMGNHQKAIDNYLAFQGEPGAFISKEYNKSNYNIAYAYYSQKKYSEAQRRFRLFVEGGKGESSTLMNDANLRIGDTYYIGTQYYKAVEYYDAAIKLGIAETDYAFYQKAICMGILKNYEEKINSLKTLIAQFRTSSYVEQAKYHIGLSLRQINKPEEALSYFDAVINEHPAGRNVKDAILQKALIHFQQGNYPAALAAYKQVVKDYPTMQDAKSALDGLKNVYLAIGNVEEYNNYIESLSFVNLSNTYKDSTNYEAAELVYQKGDCTKSVKAMMEYLARFPNGLFATDAHFYKAECQFDLKDNSGALESYRFVINRPTNSFTEEALLGASTLNYKAGNMQSALADYISLEKVATTPKNVLEAQIGQMRCSHKLNNALGAVELGEKVIRNAATPPEIKEEAHLLLGKSYLLLEDRDNAMKYFKLTVAQTASVARAEAQYNIGIIQFQLGNYKDAEQSVFDLVHQKPTYGYWVAKGLILLGETYIKLDDLFQAKATLQSVIDNYDGPTLVLEAKEIMKRIAEMEAAANAGSKEEPEELEIEGYDPILQELIDDEKEEEWELIDE